MWDLIVVVGAFLTLFIVRIFLTNMAYENKRSYYEDPREMCIEALAKVKQSGNVQLHQSLKILEKVC